MFQRDEIDWDNNKMLHTFTWGHDTVYKITNPTSDDVQPLVRQMIESVLQMYQEYMRARGRNVQAFAEELFISDDWEFLDSEENSEEIAEVQDTTLPNGIDAAEMLRRTFIEAWNHRPEEGEATGTPDYRYGHIRVCYSGWIDGRSDDNELQPENGMPVLDLIEPVFADHLWDPQFMDMKNWPKRRSPIQIAQHIQQLAITVSSLVCNCPYLLRQPWPLMLCALFFWNDTFADLVNTAGFNFTLVSAAPGAENNDSWQWRFADRMIYTYIDECEWERRCMDEVWTTFVCAQSFLKREVDGANSPPDDDNDEGPPDPDSETEGRKGKGKGKQPPKGRGEAGKNKAPKAKPKGRQPPMRGANGEGPSGTNIGARRKPTQRPDDSDEELSGHAPKVQNPTAPKSGNRAKPRNVSNADARRKTQEDTTSDSSSGDDEIPHKQGTERQNSGRDNGAESCCN